MMLCEGGKQNLLPASYIESRPQRLRGGGYAVPPSGSFISLRGGKGCGVGRLADGENQSYHRQRRPKTRTVT